MLRTSLLAPFVASLALRAAAQGPPHVEEQAQADAQAPAHFQAQAQAQTQGKTPGEAQGQASCAETTAATALASVNAARAHGGHCGARGPHAAAAGLVWSARLEGVAQAQAQWLAVHGRLAHLDAQGRTPGQRAGAAGYRYARVSENLAAGQADADAAVQAWTASDSHCANLLDPGISEMALACAVAGDGRPLWVLLLAQPAP